MASAFPARAYGFHGRRMASRVRVSGLVAVRCAASDVGEDNGDGFYMRRCVELARKAVGCMSPNPMVGCVIVKDGKVVGEGFHPKAGQPHAEVLYHCLRGALNWDDILLGMPVSTGFRSVISDSEGTIAMHFILLRPMVQVKLENAPDLPLDSSGFNSVNMRHSQLQQLMQQQIVAIVWNLPSQPANQFRQMPAPQVPQVQTQRVVRAPPLKVEGFQELMRGGDPSTKRDSDENKLMSPPSSK